MKKLSVIYLVTCTSVLMFLIGFFTSSHFTEKKLNEYILESSEEKYQSYLFNSLDNANAIYKLNGYIDAGKTIKFKWVSCVLLSLHVKNMAILKEYKSLSAAKRNEIENKINLINEFINQESLKNNCDLR